MTKFVLPLLISILFFSFKSFSQVNYSFSASAGTYTQISGTPVTLTSAGVQNATAFDEGFANNVPIGFTLAYNGAEYTTVHINTNGFLALGAPLTPGDGYYLNTLSQGPINNPSNRPIIAPLWDDLQMDASLANTISYETTGATGSRVFTVQYTNAKFDYNAAGPVISFQVKFFETSNIIQFVYRQETAAVTTNSNGASIGITAARTGSNNFISLENTSATPTISTSVSTNSIVTKPATGQVYTFTPLTCAYPTNLQTTNVTSSGGTVSWTGVSGAAGYEYAVSTSTAPPASGTQTTATTVNITGLSAGVANYFYVRTNCGTSTSAWSRIAFVGCTSNIAPENGATNLEAVTRLTWNALPGATGYLIMVSTDGVNYRSQGFTDTTSTLARFTYNTNYSYYVRPFIGIDTASAGCQVNATSFTIKAAPPAITNDSCGAAISVSGSSGVITGYTIGATPSPTGAICPPAANESASNPDDDVWYMFTAAQNGTATITVTGDSLFDAVVAAYSGTCGSLTLMSCADIGYEGDTEVLTLNDLVAGQTYYLRIYEWDVNNRGSFTLSLTGAALPVGITKFSGVNHPSKNTLAWSTTTEQNNRGFQIQRSIDGINYSSIGFVDSKAVNGNSNSPLHYVYEDVKPLADNHYRLKQIDKDEKVNFTNVVVLKGQRITAFQLSRIYPNPAMGLINIHVSAPVSDKLTFIVTDYIGKVVMQKISDIVTGDNRVSINIGRLPAGSYTVKAISLNGTETSVSKFVKQ